MAYYPDLSEYTYLEELQQPNIYNVGWLDKTYPFSVGETPQLFQDRLFEYCLNPIGQTRGWHTCQFCDTITYGFLRVEKNGKEALLGSAEIRVYGQDKVYAAPNLIYHYVVAHHYLPPSEFIEAVVKNISI